MSRFLGPNALESDGILFAGSRWLISSYVYVFSRKNVTFFAAKRLGIGAG